MRLPVFVLCTAFAVTGGSGQASVSTGGQLAEALRAGEQSIRLASTVTGHSNERLSGAESASTARYSDFPEVRCSHGLDAREL